MLRRLALVASFWLTCFLAYAGGIQQMPANAPFNEPNQEVANFNAWVAYLNGQPGPYTAGAVPPIISLGALGTAGGGTPQTCNAQRCQIAWTGLTPTTTGTNQTLVVNNSLVAANSLCRAHWASAFTAGSAMTVGSVTASAGSLSIVVVNAGTTANAVTTGTMLINCDQ